MKITLTIDELRISYAKLLGVMAEDIKIVFPHEEIKSIIPFTLESLKNSVERFRFTRDQKILAIKALRETIQAAGMYMKLSDAKWAVENWEKWIEFVKNNSLQLPAEGYFEDGFLTLPKS